MFKKTKFRTKFRPEYPVDFKFDYKEVTTLYRFLTEGGKVTPARLNKLSSSQQREMTNAVKRARNLALLPVGDEAYDMSRRPEPISPVPFEI